MQTDKMGRPDTSLNYGNREFIAVEWDDTTTVDTLYLRGDYENACVIKRIKGTTRSNGHTGRMV